MVCRNLQKVGGSGHSTVIRASQGRPASFAWRACRKASSITNAHPATTPPQAWGVYLLAVLLVWLISFYAGTLKPKKTPDASPPAVTAPKS